MSTPDTTVTLGSFQFSGFEIPTQLPFGGSQALSIHKLVGGDRVVDAMGRDYAPISWSGLFFGANAVARARTLDALRIAGEPQTLLWNQFNYLVLIRECTFDYRRQFEIPYRITCEVVSDNTNPVDINADLSTDDAVSDDLDTANDLSAAIGDLTLESLMAQVTNAVAAVASFAVALPSVVATVLQPLQAAQAYISTVINLTDANIGSEPGFGGVVVGETAAQIAADLEATQAATLKQCNLLEMSGVLGRMAANLNSINGSPNTLATVGGNLFQIAALEYGDASDWTAIATANGLTDPFINGAAVLTIPLSPDGSGGVLGN